MRKTRDASGPVRRATIVDVARLSGVSKSTVANLINGSAPLAEDTRARVLAAIEELGYRPNALARDLKRRRTRTVGVVVGNLSNPFFGELTTLIEQRCAAAGYATIICHTDGDAETEEQKIGVLLEQRVSGILMLHFSGNRRWLKEVEADTVPVVGVSVFDRTFECVASDDAKGARLAVEHLAGLGHRRIAYVLGEGTEASTNRARLRGYRQALERAGLSPAPLIAVAGRQEEGDFVALDAVLEQPNAPTGYLAGNDLTALELIDRLEARRTRVPKHASVVGFDDIALAGHGRLSLTTVRQPISRLAERGVGRLLERMEGDAPNERRPRRRLPVELVERGSTGPAPA